MKIASGLFMAAIYDLLENWQLAVRIAAMPFLILLGLNLWEDLALWNNWTSWVSSWGYVVASVILVTALVITWLRFILLNEDPDNRLINGHGKLIWPYFWREVCFAAVAVVPAMLVGFTLVALASVIFEDQDFGFEMLLNIESLALTPTFFGILVVSTWLYFSIFLRLALVLVSVALGRTRQQDGSGWPRAKHIGGPVVGLALMCSVVQTTVMFVDQLIGTFGPTAEPSALLFFGLSAVSELMSLVLAFGLAGILARLYLATHRDDVAEVFG